MDAGELSRAADLLGESLQLCRDGSAVTKELGTIPSLCELYLRTDRIAQARALLARGQEILSSPQDWGGLPAGVASAEGQIRASEGRWPEAEAAFRRAIEIGQQYELRWDVAKVHFEWAAALAGPEPATLDLQKRLMAQGLLGRAIAIWEPMGVGRHAEKCRRLLAKLG